MELKEEEGQEVERSMTKRGTVGEQSDEFGAYEGAGR